MTWPVSKLSTNSNNQYSVGLDPKVLSGLLTSRTRLVAFTACSNVLGGIVPIKEISDLVREKSKAWIAVDAVAFAPHQPLSPKDWGVDFVLWSWYKVRVKVDEAFSSFLNTKRSILMLPSCCLLLNLFLNLSFAFSQTFFSFRSRSMDLISDRSTSLQKPKLNS